MIYGEFGVYPIEIDINFEMIPFWSKVAQSDSLKYSNLSLSASLLFECKHLVKMVR